MAGPTGSFNRSQIETLVILERTGGSLSLVSVILIFIAYGMFDRLRTVPNTFIVFASIANLGSSIASLIAYDGVWLGQKSSLCQAQGFLFEMFVQSDPWWSLAMAINVLMVFFMGASPFSIKKWGWLYCLICYGGPLLIAVVCLLLRDPHKTLVYGSAGIWCWISNDWNQLRIYSYYMLIWICILSSMLIYAGIGIYVFRARNKLRQLPGSGGHMRATKDQATILSDDGDDNHNSNSWPLSPASYSPGPVSVNVVTEVSVTSNAPSPPMLRYPLSPPEKSLASSAQQPYYHSRPLPPPPSVLTTVTSPVQTHSKASLGRRATAGAKTIVSRFIIDDPVKRAYLRTSLLFALSVLVTWIPSSVNRIRGLIYADSPYGYNVATATVLPLQGVWNGVIFFVMSWKAFRQSVREWRAGGKGVVELSEGGHRRWHSGSSPSAAYAVEGRRTRESERKDSWDFADVGTEGSEFELRPERERRGSV